MKTSKGTLRTPQILTTGFLGLAAALYLLCVAPCSDTLVRLTRERDNLDFQLTGVQRDLRNSKNVRERLKSLDASLAPRRAGMLQPLLGSWAMRAKSLLDPLAAGVGLKQVAFAELPPRALPLTKPVAQRLTARRPIRLTCRGGYAALVSFLLRVERDFPYVSEQALRISASQDNAEQMAEFILEWPVDGELSAPPKPVQKGAVRK